MKRPRRNIGDAKRGHGKRPHGERGRIVRTNGEEFSGEAMACLPVKITGAKDEAAAERAVRDLMTKLADVIESTPNAEIMHGAEAMLAYDQTMKATAQLLFNEMMLRAQQADQN